MTSEPLRNSEADMSFNGRYRRVTQDVRRDRRPLRPHKARTRPVEHRVIPTPRDRPVAWAVCGTPRLRRLVRPGSRGASLARPAEMARRAAPVRSRTSHEATRCNRRASRSLTRRFNAPSRRAPDSRWNRMSNRSREGVLARSANRGDHLPQHDTAPGVHRKPSTQTSTPQQQDQVAGTAETNSPAPSTRRTSAGNVTRPIRSTATTQ